MGELRVLDKEHGDLKITWDPSNKRDIETAKKTFEDLIGKGFMAWDVGPNCKKGDNEIKEFDPNLGRIIITTPVKKG